MNKFYSPAKINIGLFVVSKRQDGYHNIETIFYPINLTDEIIFHKADTFSIISNSPIVPLDETNLIWKTKNLIEEKFKLKLNYKVEIIKNIPIFAGLGGGSSNAATAMKFFFSILPNELSLEEKIDLGLKIGSDVPFFFLDKPCFASGRGEKLKVLNDFKIQNDIVIIFPKIKIQTSVAYNNLIPKKPSLDLSQIADFETFINKKHLIKNDFEKYVFKNYPELNDIIKKLNNLGSIYSSLSGSGSAIFGIFKDNIEIEIIKQQFPNFEVFLC